MNSYIQSGQVGFGLKDDNPVSKIGFFRKSDYVLEDNNIVRKQKYKWTEKMWVYVFLQLLMRDL